MIFAVIAVGAGLGVGLVLCWRALRPPPEPLSAVITRLQTPAESRSASPAVMSDARKERIERASARVLSRAGLIDQGQLGSSLRVVGKTVEQHAFEKLTRGLLGVCVAVLAGRALITFGAQVSGSAVAAAAITLGLFGFFQPDIELPAKVKARRVSFRAHLSSYLDVVSIILAGGGGLETALSRAASAGEGWPFEELREALRRARYERTSPWDEFDRLGQDLGVDDLCQLAASAQMAGNHGARIRTSLRAKAESMRAEQAAAAEAHAESATERMIVPVVFLFLGMLAFIAFAATQAISSPIGIP